MVIVLKDPLDGRVFDKFSMPLKKITEPVHKVVVLVSRTMQFLIVCCKLSQAGFNDMFSRFFFINLAN